jgi:TP901 family phage tail tape measure protein
MNYLAQGYIDLAIKDAKFLMTHAKIEKKLKSLDRRMSKVASSAKRMLLVGGGVLAGAITAYANFSKQLAQVSTMLDAQSMRLMPAYETALKRMSRNFGESTNTLSKGLYDILSASVDASKALGVLEVATKAARAGLTTTAVSADAITTIMNAYGMSAEKAGSISDLLFAIVKRGKLTFEQLASRIGGVASTAAIAGLSLEEVGASIATMTRAGLQADIAITSLRALLMSFLKPTEGAVKAARDFDLELSSATLRAIGLTGVLKKLRGATAEQLTAIIPNTRGIAGFAAALNNASAQTSDLELMLSRTGLTQEAYEKMTTNLRFSMDKLWNSIKITAVNLGKQFEPAVEKAIKSLEKFNKSIDALSSKKGQNIVSTIKWTGGLLLAAIAISKVTKAILALKIGLTWLAAHPAMLAYSGFLGLATAAVGIYNNLGKEIGNLVTNLEHVEKEYKRIAKLQDKFNESAENAFSAMDASKLSSDALKDTKYDKGTLEYLDLEKKAVQDLLELEQRKAIAYRDSIKTAPVANQESIVEKAERAKQKVIEWGEALENITKEIKAINQAKLDAIEEKKTQLTINRLKILQEGTEERIKDISSEILAIEDKEKAELIKLNREEEKRLATIEKRIEEQKKEHGGYFDNLDKEKLKTVELFEAKRKALQEKKAKELADKEKVQAKKMLDYRKSLERDFIRYTRGAQMAQIYDIALEYKKLQKEFADDADALAKLETVIRGKLDEMTTKDKGPGLGFANPKSMYQRMASGMNQVRDKNSQENFHRESIKRYAEAKHAEKEAFNQRQKTLEQLEIIADHKPGATN